MPAMFFMRDVRSNLHFFSTKTGGIKAATTFLPHFLQTGFIDVNTSLSIFGPLAKDVRTRHVKALREAELAH